MLKSNKERIWVSVKQWKELDDKDEKNYCLQKDVIDSVIKAEETEGRTVKFAVSKNSVDRDNDTIKQAGWTLDNFKKNPVVPFGHNYKDLPIAKSLTIDIIKNQLVSVAEFVSKEIYPFADTVYQMIKGGFLNATSVGFKALAYEQNDERGGYDFLKQELLEYSVVPIPSNPDALVQARDAGIDTVLLKEWAESILDSFGENAAKGLMITKAELEEMFKTMSAPQFYIPQVIGSSGVESETAKLLREVFSVKTTDATPEPVEAKDVTTEAKDVTEKVIEEPKEDATEEPKEEVTDYLKLLSQELILRGFEVKRDDVEIVKDEKVLEGKDFSAYSDDQIFDFMLRQIGTTGTTFTIKDEVFDYELTELENKEDQLTEDSFKEVKDAPSTVEKLNPVVMSSFMPKSFEAIAAQLRASTRNYLTGNGKSCEPGSEFPVLLATFQRTALFAVIGYDRSFDEDPTYEGRWRMNGHLGVPEWVGEPKEVEVTVSMAVVDAATGGKAASYKETKTEPEAEPKEVEPKEESEESKEVKNDDVMIELDEEPTNKTVDDAIDNKLSSMGQTITDAIALGLRQAQGKLD